MVTINYLDEISIIELILVQPVLQNIELRLGTCMYFFQNAGCATTDPMPHGVISIMSVPGGVAIGTFGGNFSQTTPSESTSSNISANQPRVHGQSSETSSIRSKAFEDPYRVASDVFSPTHCKIYFPYVPPASPSTDNKQTTVTKEDDISLKSSFHLTLSDQLIPNAGLTSPEEQLQQNSAAAQKQNFENNYVPVPVVSPCYVSPPPKLQAIPEATNPQERIDSSDFRGHSSIAEDQCPSLKPSSSTVSRDSETHQSQGELDMFTHLFQDDDAV